MEQGALGAEIMRRQRTRISGSFTGGVERQFLDAPLGNDGDRCIENGALCRFPAFRSASP